MLILIKALVVTFTFRFQILRRNRWNLRVAVAKLWTALGVPESTLLIVVKIILACENIIIHLIMINWSGWSKSNLTKTPLITEGSRPRGQDRWWESSLEKLDSFQRHGLPVAFWSWFQDNCYGAILITRSLGPYGLQLPAGGPQFGPEFVICALQPLKVWFKPCNLRNGDCIYSVDSMYL